jgi:conjugal transfer mating pair stabilization protein TraN
MLEQLSRSLPGQLLSMVVAAAFFWSQTMPAYADPVSTGATAGQLFGQQIVPTGQKASADSSGNVTLNGGTSGSQTISAQQLFGGSASSNASIQNIAGNTTALASQGAATQSQLKSATSPLGQAYSVAQSTSQLAKPNLLNDPIWGKTDQTFKNWSSVQQEFSDCQTNTSFGAGTVTSHQPVYEHCVQVNGGVNTYTLTHTYSYPPAPVQITGGDATMSSCGTNCVQIVAFPDAGVASEDQFNVGGRATVTYTISDPIVSVSVTAASIQNGNAITIGPGAVTNYGKYCWDTAQNFHEDIDQNACSAGALNLPLNVSSQSSGSLLLVIPGTNFTTINSITLQIVYKPSSATMQDFWTPANEANALANPDAQCKVTNLACLSMPATDANGCATVNGVLACPDQMQASPFQGISPLCQQVTGTLDCTQFYQGQMPCWTDTEGTQHCPTVSTTQTTTCSTYANNPQCGFISSSCVQGAAGASGACYMTDQTYDCGYNVNVATTTATTTSTCSGAIRCMGTECVNPTASQSSSFAKAAAALQAAQGIGADSNCVGTGDCTIFPGTWMTCKKALGGVVDCCKGAPQGPSLTQWVSLTTDVLKLDDKIQGLSNENIIKSSWNELSGPLKSASSSVQQAGSDVIDSVQQTWDTVWQSGANATGDGAAAAGDAVTSSAEDSSDIFGFVSQLQGQLTSQAAQWVGDTFGPETANELFTNVAGDPIYSFDSEAGDYVFSGGDLGAELGGEIGEDIAAGMSVIGWALFIYDMANLLIHIIWQCEQSEFQLQMSEQLKETHYIGTFCANNSVGVCIQQDESYCVFSSPLSRIMQEQIRLQINMPWGPPDGPDCSGIKVSQLANVNWGAVDLSEWIGIMGTSGVLPNANNLNVTTLTGTTITGGSQTNLPTQIQTQASQLNVPQIREQAANQSSQLVPQ